MNIWLVSLFEQTPIDDNQDTRFNNIASLAVERGHKITYWSSSFRHNVKKQRFEKTTVKRPQKNLEVIFIKTKPYQKNISIKRLYSHYIFADKLIESFEEKNEKPNIILMAFPPISPSKKVVEWANKNCIPVVIDIIDPWPDIFKSHYNKLPKILLNLIFSPLALRVTNIFRNVDTVTAISNQYLNWVKRYNPDLTKTYCYYPAVNLPKIRHAISEASNKVEKQNNSFKVIYAGSLGFSYDIPTILKAAELLEHKQPEIMFVIAGDGPYKGIIDSYISQHNNLKYLGRISKEQLMQEYFLADVGMTQHIKGATQSVTYKLFDLLGSGIPILNSLESEMKEIILNNKVGLFNKPGDYKALAENILFYFSNREVLKQAKEKAIELTEQQGDAATVYGRLLEMLEKTVERKKID